MWFQRLTKLFHKLFWTQLLFGTKINSTSKNALWKTNILDLCVKRGSQHPIQVVAPKQKWVNLPPTFLNFLSIFWWFVTYNWIFKKICHTVFPYRQGMTHFHFRHGQKFKFFTFIIKHKSFFFIKVTFFILWKISKFFISTHVQS